MTPIPYHETGDADGVKTLYAFLPGRDQIIDLGSGSHCVIGQSMDGYMRGIAELGLSDEASYALGFNTLQRGDFEELTAAWIPVIQERQPSKTHHEIQSTSTVQYVVEINDTNNPVISRVSALRETESVRIATTRTAVWREVGEALIALADNS